MSRTCSQCGDTILEYGSYSRTSYCDKCGKTDLCWGCVQEVSNVGYWMEVSNQYQYLCEDCYEEMREEYRDRWESDYGYERERGLENPY